MLSTETLKNKPEITPIIEQLPEARPQSSRSLLTQNPHILEARILIVDDQLANITLLREILRRKGFQQLASTCNSHEAIPLFEQFRPDILLLDLHMPVLDGLAIMKEIRRKLPRSEFFPILMLTGDMTSQAKEHALSQGATDFLVKPYDSTEVILRIHNLLQTRKLHQQLASQNESLEIKVQERTLDLEETRHEILERLARAAEFRDDATGKHTQRVGKNAALLAQWAGFSSTDVELIARAAPLHDIGKVGIPDAILLKQGKLTDAEYDLMKNHTLIGGQILSQGRTPLIQMAERIALTHHEQWAGTGYPHKLAGENIPIEGRIVAIVDVFDALVHDRPYKPAWSIEEALAWLMQNQGTSFDPHLVEIFVRGAEKQGLAIN